MIKALMRVRKHKARSRNVLQTPAFFIQVILPLARQSQKTLDAVQHFTARFPKLVFTLKFLTVFGIFFVSAHKTIDPDFGWHLVSGNYYRAHGIPIHDLYTYTAQSFAWINHEIGNDVFVSYVYQAGGYVLTSALYSLLWTIALFVTSWKVRIGVVLLAMSAILPYAGVRAIVWSVLLLAVVNRLCMAKSRRIKYFIPLLLLVWVNLHGGFIVGLAVLLFYALQKWRNFVGWIVFLVSVLVTFINPYGYKVYIEVVRTLTDSSLHSNVNEWRAFYFTHGTLVFILLWIVGFWFLRRNKIKNWFSLQSFLAAASFSATRNVPLFVVAAESSLDQYFSEVTQIVQKYVKQSGALVVGVIAVSSIIWPLFNIGIWRYPNYWHVDPLANYAPKAIAYLQAHPCKGNLFNDYDYGGYIIWKLPRQLIYIDGRMPSWRDESGTPYFNRYSDILDNQAAQKSEFARYTIRCVLLHGTPNQQDLIKRLKNSGWKQIFDKTPVLLIDESNTLK